MEEICSGWLIKSPSSKYITLFSKSRFHIQIPLKSKWRRRYFVLYKPQSSLPHQYNFDYYKDEQRLRRRGSINLEDCTNILSNLDSSHYPYLFSLRTNSCKNKERVYYLAADTDEEMVRWVDCLCKLCDLTCGPTEPENQYFPPNPPERLDSMQLTVDLPQKTLSSQSLANEELSNEILEEIEAMNQGRIDIHSQPIVDMESQIGYTELSECTTGPSVNRHNLYDVPKSQSSNMVNQSKSVKLPSHNSPSLQTRSATLPAGSVPPSEAPAPPRPPKYGQRIPEELYQNIVSNSPELSRNSVTSSPQPFRPSPRLSPRQSTNRSRLPSDSNLHSNSNSITVSPVITRARTPSPTPRHSLSPNHSPKEKEKSNDIVSGQFQQHVPCMREKKFSVDSLYHNSSSLDESESDKPTMNPTLPIRMVSDLDTIYDVPNSCKVSAPPPRCGELTTKVHKYINASSKVMPVTTDEENNWTNGESINSLHMSSQTNIMANDEPAIRMSSGDTPPKRPPKPRNLSDPIVLDGPDDCNNVVVSKTKRTQSFVKDSVFSDPDEPPNEYDIRLPVKINRGNSTSSSDNDSSSEDEIVIHNKPREHIYSTPSSNPLSVKPEHSQPYETHTTNSLPHYVKRSSSMPKVPVPVSSSKQIHQSSSSYSPRLPHDLRPERSSSVGGLDGRNKFSTNNHKLSTIIKPHVEPAGSHTTDIQYVELAPEEPEQSPSLPRGSLSTIMPVGNKNSLGDTKETEYTDIDILKTQALTETRKERDRNLRKASEN